MEEFEEYIKCLEALPFLKRDPWHDFGWSYLYNFCGTNFYLNAEFGKGNPIYIKGLRDNNNVIVIFDFESIFGKLKPEVQEQILFNLDLFR